MSVETVLSVLQERGLRVEVGQDGRPYLRGPKQEITPVLLEALTVYRDEIVERLTPTPSFSGAPLSVAPLSVETPQTPSSEVEAPLSVVPREWLWRFDQRHVERPGDPSFGDPAWHPAGAWWWRHVGQESWRDVPNVQRDLSLAGLRPGQHFPEEDSA